MSPPAGRPALQRKTPGRAQAHSWRSHASPNSSLLVKTHNQRKTGTGMAAFRLYLSPAFRGRPAILIRPQQQRMVQGYVKNNEHPLK
jgi:hypothetical protein